MNNWSFDKYVFLLGKRGLYLQDKKNCSNKIVGNLEFVFQLSTPSINLNITNHLTFYTSNSLSESFDVNRTRVFRGLQYSGKENSNLAQSLDKALIEMGAT